jgi:hypothetical protein
MSISIPAFTDSKRICASNNALPGLNFGRISFLPVLKIKELCFHSPKCKNPHESEFQDQAAATPRCVSACPVSGRVSLQQERGCFSQKRLMSEFRDWCNRRGLAGALEKAEEEAALLVAAGELEDAFAELAAEGKARSICVPKADGTIERRWTLASKEQACQQPQPETRDNN